jgi:hypothetical protein
MRKPIVGIMGGSQVSEDVCRMAHELGALVARRGWVLLNGGRNTGVMAASAAGAREADGTVIGVLPDADTRSATPNLDIAIVTGMGDARNVINVLTSDLIIACPGGGGTMSEIALALKNAKRVILLGIDVGPALEAYRESGLLSSAATPAEAIEQAASALRG